MPATALPTSARRLRTVAAALALAVLLAACGGGGDAADEAASSPEAGGASDSAPSEDAATGSDASTAGDAPSADAFPVTIEHLHGETTIEQAPERVVTIGFNEQDFTLALGVVPVATREYLEFDYRSRPWAQDALGDADIPEVGGVELNIEAVAAADPDLILGTYSFISAEEYAQLSQIAPTVADLAGDPGVASSATWQQQLEAVGAALGRAEQAAALTEDVEAAFDDVRQANPGFEGQTLAVDFVFDGGHFVLGPDDIRFQFFGALGFEPPAVTGEISAEALDQLEADVLVVVGDTGESLTANPAFAALDVVAEDRTIFFGPFSELFPGALGFGSPLSLPYALELAAPPLAAAADGDPSTAVADALQA